MKVLSIKASDIDNWTYKEPRRAQELLPKLIWKLILASSKTIEDHHFPFEKAVQYIITTDYVLNLEPGKFIAVLDMKAEARNCLRVFFTFEDSRKVMATTQWWQRYLGFYEIPVGTHLLLHYRENSRKEVYLDEVERI